MMRRPRRLAWRKMKFGIGAALVLATLLIVWLTGLASLRITLAEAETRADANLAVQTAVLERLLDKFRLLSPLLARGPDIAGLIGAERVNAEPGIAAVAAGMSGAEEIWLMDASGNVIVSRQGSGSFVKRRPEGAVRDFAPVGSIADIQRTFEFRAAVEGEAALLAAQRRTDADLAEMRATLDELDRCIREGELGVDADEAFHVAVCTAADNKYFAAARSSMQSNILTGMNLTRNLSLTKPQERMKLVQAEHYEIFDAIVKNDQEAARQAMRNHVENARKRIFEG